MCKEGYEVMSGEYAHHDTGYGGVVHTLVNRWIH